MGLFLRDGHFATMAPDCKAPDTWKQYKAAEEHEVMCFWKSESSNVSAQIRPVEPPEQESSVTPPRG